LSKQDTELPLIILSDLVVSLLQVPGTDVSSLDRYFSRNCSPYSTYTRRKLGDFLTPSGNFPECISRGTLVHVSFKFPSGILPAFVKAGTVAVIRVVTWTRAQMSLGINKYLHTT
jgi:hypothetical protein